MFSSTIRGYLLHSRSNGRVIGKPLARNFQITSTHCNISSRPPQCSRLPLRNQITRCQSTSVEYDFVEERNRWQHLVGVDEKAINPTGYIISINKSNWDHLLEQIENDDIATWLEDQTDIFELQPDSPICSLLEITWDLKLDSKKVILVRKGEGNEEEINREGSLNLTPRPVNKGSLAKYVSKKKGGIFKVLYIPENTTDEVEDDVLSYLLEAYKFDRYKSHNKECNKKATNQSKVLFPNSAERQFTVALARATYLVRDLICTPAMDMTPECLQRVIEEWSDDHTNLSVETVVGTDLLSYSGSLSGGHGCGMIYNVGAAAARSDHQPRLIHVSYCPPNATKRIALVGKGVTYDTGGLNLKPGNSMLNMKKDMGGAAHVFGLMSCLVEMEAPVAIDAWIPTVENVIDGASYRPGDVLTSVTGLTTEIGNTDAEGRLILGDALALASAEDPDLILDFATLTGAARVALGTSVVPFFSNRIKLSEAIMAAAVREKDPMWQLPLWEGYEERITKSSKIADLRNIPSDNGLGGAITAALYLKQFVGQSDEKKQLPWVHVDVCAMEGSNGVGEAQGLRAMFRFIWDQSLSETGK